MARLTGPERRRKARLRLRQTVRVRPSDSHGHDFDEILPTLKSTDFDAGDMAEWRKGRGEALRKTPDGYLGDPAASDPEMGARIMAEHAAIVADAIAAKMGG